MTKFPRSPCGAPRALIGPLGGPAAGFSRWFLGFRLGAPPGQADADIGARIDAEPGSNTMSAVSIIACVDSGRARKEGKEAWVRIGGLAWNAGSPPGLESAAGGPGGRSDRPRVAHGDNPRFDSDYGERLQHGPHMRTQPEQSQAERSMANL